MGVMWKSSLELCVYIYSLQVQGSKPDILQYNGMTNSETEIESHIILRVRSTSSVFRNYQSAKEKTMQKLNGTCLSDSLYY